MMISTIIPASKTDANKEEMLRNAKNHCFFIRLNNRDYCQVDPTICSENIIRRLMIEILQNLFAL